MRRCPPSCAGRIICAIFSRAYPECHDARRWADGALAMYNLREAAELLGVRPRQLRKWIEAGHFPGAVTKDVGDGQLWCIPHEAVSAFVRSSARRGVSPQVDAAPEPATAEVMAPAAMCVSVSTSVPWAVVQHLLLAEAAQRQAWQDLALQHGNTVETLQATLACERDEILRLRCELAEMRDELYELRTQLARLHQSLPMRDWDEHTRTTQPITRAMLALIEGGR